MNVSGPLIDITGRMTILGLAPEIRTRLMSVYIMIMFTGAGAASWLGTVAYGWAGWTGTCVLALGMSIVAVLLSFLAQRAPEPA